MLTRFLTNPPRRGQVATAMLFVVVFLFLVVFFILVAPLTANISAHMTATGVDVINDTNDVIQQINDQNIQATLSDLTQDAKTSLETNTGISLTLTKYGWIAILFIIVAVLYLRSRIIVERERRGII